MCILLSAANYYCIYTINDQTTSPDVDVGPSLVRLSAVDAVVSVAATVVIVIVAGTVVLLREKKVRPGAFREPQRNRQQAQNSIFTTIVLDAPTQLLPNSALLHNTPSYTRNSIHTAYIA